MHDVTRQSSDFKTTKKILLIRVLDLPVTLVSCRENDTKKYEHIVLQNDELL